MRGQRARRQERESASAISAEKLRAIAPDARVADIARHLLPLQHAMDAYDIDSWLRRAHFLAQVAYESESFRVLRESFSLSEAQIRERFGSFFREPGLARQYAGQPARIASRVYANRMGNGSEASGDGWKYRGRGLIPITGRDAYAEYTRWSGRDFLGEPAAVSDDPNVAADVAGWFWLSRGLNELADRDDLREITRRIDGAHSGLGARRDFLGRAKAALS
jgi:putative chitinase